MQCLPDEYSCRDGFCPSVHPFFSLSPSDSFLISKVTSCDTSTVTHPLVLPLSQPGWPTSEGLVIYRVTSRWRGRQAIGKETLRGRSIVANTLMSLTAVLFGNVDKWQSWSTNQFWFRIGLSVEEQWNMLGVKLFMIRLFNSLTFSITKITKDR